MRFEKCIEEGLIRKDPRATERVKGSFEIAAYNSAFHSARALLFAKGYVERSHYCLSIALGSLYRGEIFDLLNTLDRFRLSRHNVQYGSMLVNREEAEFVIEFAEDFLKATESELSESEQNQLSAKTRDPAYDISQIDGDRRTARSCKCQVVEVFFSISKISSVSKSSR
jgi:uncharacterized protein (UPF0332 family)